jgi:hypothetical protein
MQILENSIVKVVERSNIMIHVEKIMFHAAGVIGRKIYDRFNSWESSHY